MKKHYREGRVVSTNTNYNYNELKYFCKNISVELNYVKL